MADKTWFLITTADERSWKTDSPILFLGEWCLRYERKSIWDNLEAEVVPPYGWRSGQKETDFNYMQNLCERLLHELTEMLNHYHNTKHSVRYWRIMLGSWLHRFVAIIYNRWSTIQFALERYAISNTAILDFPSKQLTPLDYLDFARLYRSDDWNHAIYGKILQECTNVTCDRITINASDTNYSQKFTRLPSRTFKQRIRRFMANGAKLFEKIFTRSTDAVLISTYLPFIEECKLNLSLGQIPTHRRSLPTPHVSPDFNARNQFRFNTSGAVKFEEFIRNLIPQQIPSCYLEGYSALLSKVKELPWPEKPKLIFTSNNFDSDEVFKAWTASKIELHVPYIIGQHGANYGTSQFNPSEIHEVATADRYLTWGWEDGCIKHFPISALTVVGKSSMQRNTKGGLVLVERIGGHREEPWDEIPAFKEYLEDQFTFVERLPTSIKNNIIVRLYAANLCRSWSEDLMWKERCPDIKVDYGVEPIGKLIEQNRLTIYAYNSTGVLELLALNIPMIIFFNVENWPFRENAKIYFEQLKKVGILHKTPESAADKVNEIWNDVEGWWGSEELQTARLIFCNQFARVSKNSIQEIKQALLTTISSNH